MKNAVEYVYLKVLVVLFYLLIYIGWGIELCKKVYYTVFRIPHVKRDDKFHPIYRRFP